MWIYSVPVHAGQLLCQGGKTGPYYFFSFCCWCRVVGAPRSAMLSVCLAAEWGLEATAWCNVCCRVVAVTYRSTARANKGPRLCFCYSVLNMHYKLLRSNYVTEFAVVSSWQQHDSAPCIVTQLYSISTQNSAFIILIFLNVDVFYMLRRNRGFIFRRKFVFTSMV
jgi:hypothetical protein